MVEVITIAGPCAPPAGAAFTWTPEDIFAGFEVTFAATVMTGTEPLTYDWLITDLITSTSDITGTGQAFTYAFDVTGTYTVTLTVSNPCGAAVPIVNFVVVTPPVYSAYLPATLKATGP
jgi:PKD repeat protein